MRIFKDLVVGTVDLVFAPACAACGGAISTRGLTRMVCNPCWARSRQIPGPRCGRCSTPLSLAGKSERTVCSFCADLRPAIRGIASAFLMAGPVRQMVHALKYRGWHGLADEMGRRMAETALPPDSESEVELVVSVPTSAARVRHRGYDQAALLANVIARNRGLERVPEVLLRGGRTGSQTSLHPDQRRANVAGAFTVQAAKSDRISGRHILLVDDVWTTGATATVCADQLLRFGVRAVTVLTFARALPEFESHDRRIEQLAFSNS